MLWLQNFVNGRTNQTEVGDLFSEVRDLISGVVQGSGIGPVMLGTIIAL